METRNILKFLNVKYSVSRGHMFISNYNLWATVSRRNPPKRELYMLAFDCCFSYDDHDPRVCCDILNFEADRKVYFNNIDDCMPTKERTIKLPAEMTYWWNN